MKINLGAGSNQIPGWVNVDSVWQPGIDVVHDLDDLPWPFIDGEADRIVAFDVFEHVNDPIAFMVQAHRILRPGGKLLIHTSYLGNPESFTDPTHKRFCTEQTFDYWIDGTPQHKIYNAAYGGVTFERFHVGIGPDNYLDVRLVKPREVSEDEAVHDPEDGAL